jgi:hypothetical protein
MSLAAIVLDDGSVIGPDSHNAAARVKAHLDAEKAIAAGILGLGSAPSQAEVAGYLQGVVKATKPAGASLVGPAQLVYNQRLSLYERSFARHYLQALARHGVGSVLVLAQARGAANLPNIHR